MEPVLILSYFYPPCNLTASQRTDAWVRYFPEFGLEPILITRNWDIPIKNQYDINLPTGEKERVEKLDIGEVHYLPFKGNLRDRIQAKHGPDSKKLIRRLLTMWELFAQNYTNSAIPYNNMLDKAREILKARPEIKKLIVSTNPYQQFAFAYQLKKEFPRLEWYADYRDDWTTRELNAQSGTLFKIIRSIEAKSEKKWLSNSTGIISVTEVLTDRISRFLNKPGFTALNGFFEEDFTELSSQNKSDSFVFNYTGYLYNDQPVEQVTEAFKKLIEKYSGMIDIVFRFLGTAYHPPSKERILLAANGIESNMDVTERISRQECLQFEADADAFIMMPYIGHKGIPGSKLYQYLGHNKPIILYPSDDDIIERTIKDANSGFVCRSEEEFIEQCSRLIDHKIESGSNLKLDSHPELYSRRYSTKQIAELLKGSNS